MRQGWRKEVKTQYGGEVSHLGLAVLKVMDEDGGEAAHHPDADMQKKKGKETKKLSSKSSFLTHYWLNNSLHFIKMS